MIQQKKQTKKKCGEAALAEFPELLFCTAENGIRYFDATAYISAKGDGEPLSAGGFIEKMRFQVSAIAEEYGISPEELTLEDGDGHQLIEGSMCYLFLSYVNPQLCAYFNSMVDDVFSNGFTVSDSHLAAMIKNRTTPELCAQILGNGTTVQGGAYIQQKR